MRKIVIKSLISPGSSRLSALADNLPALEAPAPAAR